MKTVQLIFPHQLFKNTTWLNREIPVFLIEEFLFFKQYKFHKQKLVFHRASMKFYEQYLIENGFDVHYVEANNALADVRKLLPHLINKGLKELRIMNPSDNWLEKRITRFKSIVDTEITDNLLFMNSKEELEHFFKSSKKKFFQTSFYKQQRIQRSILIKDGKPLGGNWTYDVENRKKYPKDKSAPKVYFPEEGSFYCEAKDYVLNHFETNVGTLNQKYYPVTHEEAETWLQDFFKQRFHDFGIYEDAMVETEHFLNHSVLSPMLNVGLLQPLDVIEKAILFADENNVPINSLEGFVRQILGWREFIRGVYEVKGSEERTRNFWGHHRKIPKSFYDGTTGILPVDQTIKKVLRTGYAHHIERLMVLGNFMLLCEFHPDEVYQWFMELFIDAYDWVMVPNVYGMSLFADGGIMSTKPYISSSNYIKKMSDYPNGDWKHIWDGLFWSFMNKNRKFLSKNPRLRMLLSSLDKMDASRRARHLIVAEHFLENLNENKNMSQLNLL
jgi:deoxyribodipyrimidine photolyase-related protein